MRRTPLSNGTDGRRQAGKRVGPYNRYNSPRSTIGSLVRKLRIQADLTQVELGKKCGWDDWRIYNIERNKHEQTITTILHVLRALGESPAILEQTEEWTRP